MSNFDEQMRLFEAEVGGAAGPPRQMAFRPAFIPRSAMPRGQVPPPPSYPRPQFFHPETARPGIQYIKCLLTLYFLKRLFKKNDFIA